MNEEIIKKVGQVIRKIKPVKEISLESNLKENLGFDSLDLITAYFELEKEFGIRIEDEDLESDNLIEVGGIVEYIHAKMSKSE